MDETEIYRKQQMGGMIASGRKTALIVVDFVNGKGVFRAIRLFPYWLDFRGLKNPLIEIDGKRVAPDSYIGRHD